MTEHADRQYTHLLARLAPEERERMRRMIDSVPFRQLITTLLLPRIALHTTGLDNPNTNHDHTQFLRGQKYALAWFVTTCCDLAGMANPLKVSPHFPRDIESPSPETTETFAMDYERFPPVTPVPAPDVAAYEGRRQGFPA